MPGQTAAAVRRQPLLMEVETDGKNGGRKGCWSLIGETAGECAAVCCCCPCGMMNLLILAVYRLPAGIWRRKRRRRLLRNRMKFVSEGKENTLEMSYSSGSYLYTDEAAAAEVGCGQNDAVQWENEIWEGFGFWRSHSARDSD